MPRMIGIYVPDDFPKESPDGTKITGNVIKNTINDIFQWLNDNTDDIEKYKKTHPHKGELVMLILGGW
jgi:hypothetical protein